LRVKPARNRDSRSYTAGASIRKMLLMRVRTLTHLLPWLLILGLGSCDGQRVAWQNGPDDAPSRSGSGIESERGGPGLMGAEG
jgi:hypothetical protein